MIRLRLHRGVAEPSDPSGTYDYTIQIWTVGMSRVTPSHRLQWHPVLDWSFTRPLTGTGTFEVTFDPTANTGKAFDVYMVGAILSLPARWRVD